MTIAADPREAASNRQDALAAATNLVQVQEPTVKAETFALARSFVTGDHDGSHLDELTGEPHPLSAFKITMVSASLRGPGLRLAHASATTLDDHEWIRDQAMNLLRSNDQHDISIAAALTGLPTEITRTIDANLLAAHQHSIVRQASAFLSMNEPDQYPELLPRLATDPDFRVRRALAHALTRHNEPTPTTTAVLETLTHDPRHSVRSAIPHHDSIALRTVTELNHS